MFKTLRISFSLKNTYRVNGLLYSIKQIPLLKKIISDSVYQIKGFKILANILSVIWEITSIFLGKLLYFLIMIVGVAEFYKLQPEESTAILLHLIVFLTILGAFLNTYMFNPTKDKYYAMILLGMDAREYTLINYFYTIIKVFIGFMFCMFLFFKARLSVWQCVLVPFFVVGAKITVVTRELQEYEKKGSVNNENILNRYEWIAVAFFLLVAYGVPVMGFVLPEKMSITIMSIVAVIGVLCSYKIFTFQYYKLMYKELLLEMNIQMYSMTQEKLQQQRSFISIGIKDKIYSNKRGFEYLNELFIKRHHKILWKSTKKITCIIFLAVIAILVLCITMPVTKDIVNIMLLDSFPYFVFIMYIINRGSNFTEVLFINCDRSLLTYSFYKHPKRILQLFQIRLREIIKINLVPAAVLGVGLAVLLYISGGTNDVINYTVVVASLLCFSIFFSVHYMAIYYLLQPYNIDTQIKSGMYQVIIWGTYFACYMMMHVKMSTLVFGIMSVLFCVTYIIVASVLVFKFAPKTFKIRN